MQGGVETHLAMPETSWMRDSPPFLLHSSTLARLDGEV